MSARLQLDTCVNKIILKGFKLLKYRPIFEDYDVNRSFDMEYLSAILHTNELQQLKENIYFPQTEENLQTHYKEIFDEISQAILNLECNKVQLDQIKVLRAKIQSLSFSWHYLNKYIFYKNSKIRNKQALYKLDVYSPHDFINDKEDLLKAIESYFKDSDMV